MPSCQAAVTPCLTIMCLAVHHCPTILRLAVHQYLTCYVCKCHPWCACTALLASARSSTISAVHGPEYQQQQWQQGDPERQHREQHILQLLLEGGPDHCKLDTCKAVTSKHEYSCLRSISENLWRRVGGAADKTRPCRDLAARTAGSNRHQPAYRIPCQRAPDQANEP